MRQFAAVRLEPDKGAPPPLGVALVMLEFGQKIGSTLLHYQKEIKELIGSIISHTEVTS